MTLKRSWATIVLVTFLFQTSTARTASPDEKLAIELQKAAQNLKALRLQNDVLKEEVKALQKHLKQMQQRFATQQQQIEKLQEQLLVEQTKNQYLQGKLKPVRSFVEGRVATVIEKSRTIFVAIKDPIGWSNGSVVELVNPKDFTERIATAEVLRTPNGGLVLLAQGKNKIGLKIGDQVRVQRSLEDRVRELEKELEKNRQKLEIPPELIAPGKDNPPPPNLEGTILSVDAKSKLVLLSVGSDAGLKVNHKLEVFRLGTDPKYLGRVVIVETSPKQAIARRMNGARGELKSGDRFASQILPGK